ncbi:MAG: butyrate kinase [Clostridia bacterium]|nr:butyrate kinase [Clostridia bacterium]
MLILVINPGATSTKIAVFEAERQIFKATIEHAASELAPFLRIVDQKDYRTALIRKTLSDNGFKLSDFSALSCRGGLLKHIPSGTYRVDENVLYDVYNNNYGEHASNLGVIIGKELADEVGVEAFFVDPVSVDEMYDVARVSGLCGMERESYFHALNQKGAARKAAKQLQRAYEDLNLIVVHMGGGVSVAAHEGGRVVDVFNVLDEGSFSMNRGGSLPVQALINLCFSGKSKQEIKQLVRSEAGVYSYLKTHDFREVEARALANDKDAKLVFDALVYQHCKDIGAMAAVLKFKVDAIVFTGGMAHSKVFIDSMSEYVGKLAPIIVIAGETEMESLALGALRALLGEPIKEYGDVKQN